VRVSSSKLKPVHLEYFSGVGALAIVGLPIFVLFGWAFDISSLKSVMPGLATMKVNTAFAFLALGLAIRALYQETAPSGRRIVGCCLAGVAILIGGLTLCEYLVSRNFGIDELFITETLPPDTHGIPGRMAPTTALGFVLMGLALVLVDCKSVLAQRFSHFCVGISFMISMLALVGYAYDMASLYSIGIYSSMALHTAFAFVFMSALFFAMRPNSDFMQVLTSRSYGGYIARNSLPMVPAIFLALGWMCIQGERAGWFNFEFGVALMVIIGMVIASMMVGWQAHALHHMEKAKVDFEHLASTDALTGLHNRRAMLACLKLESQRASRYRRAVSVVLVDLDHFKSYNDSFGHPAGDGLLRELASFLKQGARDVDYVARYGGEEFLIVLPETDMHGALKFANRMREEIENASWPLRAITASFGISSFLPEIMPSADFRTLIHEADQALYASKNDGRNCVTHFKLYEEETKAEETTEDELRVG